MRLHLWIGYHCAWGRHHLDCTRAIAALLHVLLLGQPLAWLLRTPEIAWLGDWAYRAVSRNGTRISTTLGLAACDVPRGDEGYGRVLFETLIWFASCGCLGILCI